MTRKVRFIHAADIHLGTPIRGLRDVGPNWAAALQASVADAWERVVNAALTHEVDFVVLAGDMFDSSRPSYGDYLRLFEGLERLDEEGIPTYLVTGNHDPYTAWERDTTRLPSSATLLGANGPQFALFSRDEEPLCLIGGRSYYSQAWPEDEDIAAGITRASAIEALVGENGKAADAPFMVGVVHTALSPDQSKAWMKLDDLLAADVDYWACGHLHERCAFPSEGEPRVVFSGCVQGRGVSETGERGCYLVELEEVPVSPSGPSAGSGLVFSAVSSGHELYAATPWRAGKSTKGLRSGAVRARLEFIPTSSIIFQRIEVDVSACQTLADVRHLVQSELFHENGKVHCDELIVQIVLSGETHLHEFLAKREILDDLRQQINNAHPNFFCDSLVSMTCFPDEGKALGGNEDYFPKIVMSIAEEQRFHEDTLVNFVQSEFVKRGIPVPGSLSVDIGKSNDEAERLVLDLLREAGV